jgi:hypothetical protein
MSYSAIHNYLSCVVSFYKINDIILNTKKSVTKTIRELCETGIIKSEMTVFETYNSNGLYRENVEQGYYLFPINSEQMLYLQWKKKPNLSCRYKIVKQAVKKMWGLRILLCNSLCLII